MHTQTHKTGWAFKSSTHFQDLLNKTTNETVEHHALFDYLEKAGMRLQAEVAPKLAEQYYLNVTFDNKNMKIAQSKVKYRCNCCN